MKNNYPKAAAAFFLLIVNFNLSITAQTWAPLGLGLQTDSTTNCYALCNFNGKLIAAGVFSAAGGSATNNIAQWDGSSWSPLSTGFPADANFYGVYALCIYDQNLFAAGSFDNAGGVAASNIAQWSGTAWSAVNTGIPGTGSTNFIDALIEYDGSLIAGGVSPAFPTSAAVYTFNDNTVSESGPTYISKGLPNGLVTCFAIYEDTLFAGGVFHDTDGITYGLATLQLQDTLWTLRAPLGAVGNAGAEAVYSLAVYNGSLYAGGTFDSIGGVAVSNIARGNGTSWASVGSGIQFTDSGHVYALASYLGNLYAGGVFTGAGGVSVSNIAEWNDTVWASAGGVSSFGNVNVLLAPGNNLFAGGFFTEAGAVNANSVAEFSTTTGISEVPDNGLVHVYPNPGNGQFTVSLQNAGTNYTINVYNITGERIGQAVLNPDKTEIDLSTAAKGVYLYRITSAEGDCFASGKIVMQ
jgi:hypothetical protein